MVTPKSASAMLRSLVCSEMCIVDRYVLTSVITVYCMQLELANSSAENCLNVERIKRLITLSELLFIYQSLIRNHATQVQPV